MTASIKANAAAAEGLQAVKNRIYLAELTKVSDSLRNELDEWK